MARSPFSPSIADASVTAAAAADARLRAVGLRSTLGLALPPAESSPEALLEAAAVLFF